VRSVIRLARSLGLRVIAEGVETEQQLAELVALECDWAQGFYFSRPVEPGTFTALLETRAPRV
jgi:EAL domain-containing protein (putative c-di-GMP-specific phosphodiesterase class I)